MIAILPLFFAGCEAVLGPEFEPRAAMVAIELPDEGASRVGPVPLDSGAPIRLHAVLEAREDEATVYYTDAERLIIDEVEISPESLRPWPENPPIRCLWQTLQVSAPFIEVGSVEQLDRLSFVNFSHPDWGLSCSAIATITARQRETLTVPDDAKRLAFGSQSYQVWVEVLKGDHDLVSQQSFKSANSVIDDPASFPRATMWLDQPLRAPTSVFGLTQLEPAPEAGEAVESRLRELHGSGLFFSRTSLFADLVEEVVEEDGARWQLIELDDGRPFLDLADGETRQTDSGREGVRPGDLLRVSDRFVVLFRDVGIAGALDGADLCFDYERGAIVRRLQDVFVGDLDGDVEWAKRSP